jgi:hypothetical protein
MATSSSGVAPSVRTVSGRLRPPLRRVPADIAVSVGLVIVGTLVCWIRLPASAQNTLWAEDARRFLNDAVHLGPLPALFTPYAGYLHTVPRTIAGVTVQFVPVDYWANAMALGACLVAAGVAALVYILSREIVPWLPARIALAAITLLDPLAPHEVLGNTANLHWYFLWLTPWLLLYRPRSRAGSWLLAVVALLAALTEIQMVLFLPLVLWRFRDGRRLPVRALYVVGVVAQLATTILWPRGLPVVPAIGLPSLAYGYLINAVMSIWLPTSADIGRVIVPMGPAAGVILMVPFLVAAIWGFRRGSGIQRTMIAMLLVGSMALYAIAVEVSPGAFYDYARMSSSQLGNPWLARYGVVPSMMLLALVPVALSTRSRAAAQRRFPPDRRSLRAAVPWVALALTGVLMLAQFVPSGTRRSGGPLWEPQVTAQREKCEARSPSTREPLAGAPASAWIVYVPCRILVTDAS